MISERKPVVTMADLETLDQRDMISGYLAGFSGNRIELGPEFNRSYWHGWCNGMRDSYRMQPTADSAQLAREFLDHQRTHGTKG